VAIFKKNYIDFQGSDFNPCNALTKERGCDKHRKIYTIHFQQFLAMPSRKRGKEEIMKLLNA